MGSESLFRAFQIKAITQTFNMRQVIPFHQFSTVCLLTREAQVRTLSQTSAVLTTYLMACLPLFITLFKIFPYKPCLSGHKSMNNDLIVLL